MKVIEFIRLVRKHIVLLMSVSVLLAVLTTLMTRDPKLAYTSKTTLYTGLATGSTIEMDKAFNYSLTNTAFDNLLNIIKSRETQQDVAIRLLSQHLLLQAPDPKYISEKSYAELKRITPAYIYKYVAINGQSAPLPADSLKKDAAPVTDSSTPAITHPPLFPPAINRAAYEQTVKNLTRLMESSDTNFVYRLLNFQDPHYSIVAISGVKAERINTSDLIRLTYEVDDPGICQQTLAIFNEVCIKNYKNIKENRSDAVVKYFESQLRLAEQRLKTAEDKLLDFNKSNNIINYYEQSKAVAVVKEDMQVDYSNKKAQLAGLEAAITRLENKLNIQQQVQLKSTFVLEKKKLLGKFNYNIAMAEADEKLAYQLPELKKQADILKEEIRKSVDDLYAYQNTTDGLPVSKVLNEWINNLVEAETLRAKLKVMDQNNREFQEQYSIYAPAGANIKRIEREISVSEQGYLEILHGLNLAKLKQQDNELSSNLKAVDAPFYPLSSLPSKRKVLIIAAAFLGFILMLGIILAMEYFDNSLRNLKHAASVLKISSLGVFPKIYLHSGLSDFALVQQRLTDIALQQLEQAANTRSAGQPPRTILFVSTQDKEGKSVVVANLARQLHAQGKKVLVLNYEITAANTRKLARFPLLTRLLGYPDPRIQYNSPFLQPATDFLSPDDCRVYSSDYHFYNAESYQSLLDEQTKERTAGYDYVLIEFPAMLVKNYPVRLVQHADMTVLVCRANRAWSESDAGALKSLLPLTDNRIGFMLNGAEINEIESVLGDLPKKRNVIRKKLKNLLRFRFYSKNQI